MITKEKYIIGDYTYLIEGKCIEVIEKELDTFFNIRLKFIYLICELYISGSIKNSNDILKYLKLSNYEIKTLRETVVYKISRIIDCNSSQHATYFNKYNNIEKIYMYYIENNIKEFAKTEIVLKICERFLDKSLSKMFETCCQGKMLNYAFNHIKFAENFLGSNSLKRQKQKHSNIISEQLKGFLLNLKCDLRNELLNLTFLLLDSL